MAGIALEDRVELISIVVPLEVVVENYKHSIFSCFWIKRNLVRPNHECERGCAVLVEQIYVVFLSLGKVILDLVLKRVDTIC